MRLPPAAAVVRYGRTWTPTIRYVMETEVHVYAFSIAANVLLSLFPFLVLMLSVTRFLFHWQGASDAVDYALRDTFALDVGRFVFRNVSAYSRPIEWVSILLLLFTANGIFEPLEVALNRAWGITRNRSFFRNQLISMGLVFICGALTLVSIRLTTLTPAALPVNNAVASAVSSAAQYALYKAAAVPVSVFTLFLVYWVLPNKKIPAREVMAPAILVGIALELLKYVNFLIAPWFVAKTAREYGPFVNSVSIILWSFVAAMVVLAGAEHTARNQASRAVVVPARRDPALSDTSRL